ncbi:ATP-dependent DNA helicase [Trichonephila clavipes]|nr:ATP-dependent DNA helicase [Trichonephila clavipes]
MGGVVVLLTGDFRQTSPIIEIGTAADEINACLKVSYLWIKVKMLYLTTNMRVQLFSDVDSGAYAQKLLEIGEGPLDIDQEANTHRRFFADKITPSISTRALLKYFRIPTSEITPTSHSYETKKSPALHRESGFRMEFEKGSLSPGERRESLVGKLDKKEALLLH